MQLLKQRGAVGESASRLSETSKNKPGIWRQWCLAPQLKALFSRRAVNTLSDFFSRSANERHRVSSRLRRWIGAEDTSFRPPR